jgi:hypothetical protein
VNLIQELGGEVSKEIKYAEADTIGLAVTNLTKAVAPLEALIDAEAPAAVADVIAAVEKADVTVIGPANSALVNGVLNAYSASIQAELTPLLADANSVIVGFVPKVIAALQAVQTKLQSEAAASV